MLQDFECIKSNQLAPSFSNLSSSGLCNEFFIHQTDEGRLMLQSHRSWLHQLLTLNYCVQGHCHVSAEGLGHLQMHVKEEVREDLLMFSKSKGSSGQLVYVLSHNASLCVSTSDCHDVIRVQKRHGLFFLSFNLCARRMFLDA
jgi:hypothetical protein